MIDIGANLTNESFSSDFDDVLLRAQKEKVNAIIVTGSNVNSSQQAFELTQQHPQYLYSTAGLHPHEADDFNQGVINHFRQLLENTSVVAIGETGLDFNRNFSLQENQIKSFEAHLELAQYISKPLFLHERDAFDTMYSILNDHNDLCQRAVIHCFTGNLATLRRYLDLGLYIGITGWICDEKRGSTLREIMRYAPLDRLMIESDAPYLTPHKKQLQKELQHKHRNEPWTLKFIAETLAKAQGIKPEELIKTVRSNTKSFFDL